MQAIDQKTIPKEWKSSLLDDYITSGVIELTRGNVISKIDIQHNPGDNPIYSSSIHKEALFGRYNPFMFDEELITWSVDGGGNFFYRPKHKFSVTNVSGILRILKKDRLIYKYLFYLLDWEHSFFKFDYQTKAHPSVIRRMYDILEPSIFEQKKIVDVLTSVDDEIKKIDSVVLQTEELKKGLMQDLFAKGIGHKKFKKTEIGTIPEEWNISKLSEVAKVERGKFSHRPRNAPEFYGGDIPFIQTGNVVNSNGKISSYTQTLNEKGLSVSKLFKKGTIVITIAANIGDTGILQFDSCFPDSLIGITPSEKIDSIFLEYYLRTQKEYLNSISTQSAQKNINLEKLNPLPIILPTKDEQKKIAGILLSIDEKIIVNTKYRATLTKLKKGLMSDLLSGKVRVEVKTL
jgi:type I restriction enzyme S subunit